VFTIGTIVAFGSYLGTALRRAAGAGGRAGRVSTSMVSFERVFEVIDLPQDIVEKENALALRDVRANWSSITSLSITDRRTKLLKDVKRYGRHGRRGRGVLAKGNGKKPRTVEGRGPAGNFRTPEADATSQARESP
jgi:ATP-binding cassette, subfamily B, bacterial